MTHVPFCYRQFTNQAKHGVAKEEEWNKALEDYLRKYPDEAREFKQLLSGELPQDWEKALPVSAMTNSLVKDQVFMALN